ncbi:N-acetyltransferase [Ktedonobacter sp. SOSP1-85]|uniref:GNAT family N-acetyltransferase n=1 Tax=Ktedonobacter sp. SOSP1-85 TaxID=2778367 RepID=UPI00191559BA|nr:GNAT family protein [Ktedonobacter sp. SOSP1-85]GHO74064.1 N-acetyltransferase [Ktedonobacter sp. SOSP1-85]
MELDTSASIWQGKLVRLRSHEPGDWENYWIWDQDSESERKDGPLSFPRSQERMKHWTQEAAVRKQEGNNWNFLIENNEGKVVGRIGSHDRDPRVGHFGYGLAISKEHRRKGYASEVILLLLRYFFQELRYQKVTIQVASFNEDSIGLHEHLGFQLEGRIRRAIFTKGQYFDVLNYGLTVEEFEEKHAHKFS